MPGIFILYSTSILTLILGLFLSFKKNLPLKILGIIIIILSIIFLSSMIFQKQIFGN